MDNFESYKIKKKTYVSRFMVSRFFFIKIEYETECFKVEN